MKRILALLMVLGMLALLAPAPAVAGGAGAAIAGFVAGALLAPLAILSGGEAMTEVRVESRTIHHDHPRFIPRRHRHYVPWPGTSGVVEYHPFGYRPGPWVWVSGYWEITWVPVQTYQNVWVADSWSPPDGQWTSGYWEQRLVTVQQPQQVWVPGRWQYTGPVY